MKKQQQINLATTFASSFQPIFNGNLWEWCECNLVLPVGAYAITGPFNSRISPYLRKPMEDFTDSGIRQINIASSTQTGKSLIQEVLTPYILLQDPSPVIKLFPTDTMANVCMNTRILPLLKNNKDTNQLLATSKYSSKTGVLQLANQFIKNCGTSENNLHSLSFKYAILDEVWLYEDSSTIDKVKARLTAFENSYKLILTSQPDMEGSQLHKEYIKGSVYEWGWRCPECNKLQLYEFQGEKDGKFYGVVWLKNKSLTYDQRTDYTKLVCQHCFHEINDTEDDRIALIQQGEYLQLQQGDRTINSYSWPGFVNKDLSFKKIAMQYLQAKTIFNNTGIVEDLRLFRNQKLGKFWKRGELIDNPRLLQDITDANEEWKDETHRFLTIDVQQSCMYWLVTSWSNKVSEARLVDWGVCVGFDELVVIKDKYKIRPVAIAIDSGDDTVPIYKESVLRGAWYDRKLPTGQLTKMWATWICLKGDGGKITPKTDYMHPDGSKRYYGVETQPDPQWPQGSKFGRYRARLYLWSNYSIKTLLTNMIAGKLPFKFRFNHRADETFTKQMYSEYLDAKTGRFQQKEGIDNHLWDCMCEAVVLALMAKCYIPNPSLAESDVKNDIVTTPSALQLTNNKLL